MKRGYAAQIGERFTRLWRAKIPIPVASYGVFRNFYHCPLDYGNALSP